MENNQIFFMQYFSQQDIQKLKTLLHIREKRGENEIQLWKKVEFFTPLFRMIPGVSCICIGNSLAMNAAHENSDIDLFIITRKNRLWTARIALTIFLSLLGQRKTAKKHAGKFCLSFFIAEDSLSLETIATEKDIYLAYWIETLVPIINKDASFALFLQANTWYRIEQMQTKSIHVRDIKNTSPWIFDSIGNVMERLLKKVFLPKTLQSFKALWKPYGVIITDTMLKFHDSDQRKIISQKVSPLASS